MTKRRKQPDAVTTPRKHMREIVAHLRDIGATDIVVTQPKHYRVTYILNGRSHVLHVSGSPRCPEAAVGYSIQAIKRMSKAAAA